MTDSGLATRERWSPHECLLRGRSEGVIPWARSPRGEPTCWGCITPRSTRAGPSLAEMSGARRRGTCPSPWGIDGDGPSRRGRKAEERGGRGGRLVMAASLALPDESPGARDMPASPHLNPCPVGLESSHAARHSTAHGEAGTGAGPASPRRGTADHGTSNEPRRGPAPRASVCGPFASSCWRAGPCWPPSP